jgi:molecular chaperone GrpE (heat shock protein)
MKCSQTFLQRFCELTHEKEKKEQQLSSSKEKEQKFASGLNNYRKKLELQLELKSKYPLFPLLKNIAYN